MPKLKKKKKTNKGCSQSYFDVAGVQGLLLKINNNKQIESPRKYNASETF